MTSKSSYTPILHLSSFTPVFFLYNLHKRSIHEQHIFSRLGMYMTKTAWFLSLDIKVADRGLDL